MPSLQARTGPHLDNVALGRPSTQSSVGEWSIAATPEADAAFANDGVLQRPDRDFGNHTAMERNPWWQVDLGGPHEISVVRLHNRPSFADRLTYFSLWASLDGETWNAVYRKRDSSRPAVAADGAIDITLSEDVTARWIRVRLDGVLPLSLKQVEVLGRPSTAQEAAAALARSAELKTAQDAFRTGRAGQVIDVAGFEIFADAERYSAPILGALGRNDYEGREREILVNVVEPGDRILEIGTAIGVISMTAAAIAGPENVMTFEANPYIVADARRNFAYNGMGAITARNAVLYNRARWAGPSDQAAFHVSRDFWASRLFVSDTDTDIVEVVQVPTASLEDAIAEHGATFLICDIEGGEIDLLTEADLTGIRKILLETHYWSVGEAATSKLIRKLVLDGFDIDLEQSGRQVTFMTRQG